MLFTIDYDILTQNMLYCVSSNGKTAKTRKWLHFFENWRDTETSGHPSNKLMYPINDYLVKDRQIVSTLCCTHK